MALTLYEEPSVGFNSQPPEGGWLEPVARAVYIIGFNSQPPEGGWDGRLIAVVLIAVSTHSRPKAAGAKCPAHGLPCPFQLTAARRRLDCRQEGQCCFI